jgi:hypothetical protein
MAINVRDQAAWDAQVAALREAKRNPPPREREVREPGEESARAKAQRISLKAFIAKDGEEVVHPLLEHLAAAGSLLAAPTGRGKGEYDAWRALVKDNPDMGMRMSRKGGLPIDIAAQQFGMEPEEYVEAIRREWMEFKEWRANNGKTDAQLQEEYEADRAEALQDYLKLDPRQCPAADWTLGLPHVRQHPPCAHQRPQGAQWGGAEAKMGDDDWGMRGEGKAQSKGESKGDW